MGTFHDNVMKLSSIAAHEGLSPQDILVELKVATLSSGTVEVPTAFENGQIIGVHITQNDTAAVNATESFACDKVVSSGAITVNGKTGSTATVFVTIYARPKYS